RYALYAYKRVVSMIVFLFFQAEDGIRDGHVTGVQTCALPIFEVRRQPAVQRGDAARRREPRRAPVRRPLVRDGAEGGRRPLLRRSEERRVGKEGSWRGAAAQ